jgi:hypothetical protein
LLVVLVTCGASAGSCAAQRRNDTDKTTPTATATPTPAPRAGEIPVQTDDTFRDLAVGSYGTVHQPFVFVARDAETYAALRTLVTVLPDERADFFQTHVVVASFLGQRRSGGYAIEIKETQRGQLTITEHAPPKNAIVTEALTAPFRVVALALAMDSALRLKLDAAWQKQLRPYKINDGELLVYGGFAGRRESTQLTGSLGVMRLNEWATFFCDVRSVGGRRERYLSDAATGRVDASGHVTLARLDAFALSGATRSPFRADGTFTNGEQNLTLNLETVPNPHIADNFAARGKINATATAPAPAKTVDEDVPL